jgi:hypothetical protein
MTSSRPNRLTVLSTRRWVGHLADVGVDADNLVAQRGDLLLEGLRRLGVRDVVDGEVGALPSQFEHDGHANAAVAAGDDGDFSFDTHSESSLVDEKSGFPRPGPARWLRHLIRSMR